MIVQYYRCPQYYNLPAYCTYQQDPNDACCRKPRCDPSQTVTPNTNTNGPTITPGPITPRPFSKFLIR